MNELINTEDKITSMAKALKVVFKTMPKGFKFSGYDLQRKVAALYPKARRMYPDTILREMRKSFHYDYKVINHNKSIYERI